MEEIAKPDMTAIYALIGGIIIAQLGTILTVIIWLIKATWKASAMNSDIEQLKKDVNNGFKMFRSINKECDSSDK